MAEDSLNYHIRHSKAIQVAPQTASRCMPPLPFGKTHISRVCMLLFLMGCFGLPTSPATIQRGKDDPVYDATESQRLTSSVREGGLFVAMAQTPKLSFIVRSFRRRFVISKSNAKRTLQAFCTGRGVSTPIGRARQEIKSRMAN